MKQYPQYNDDLQEYVGILYELNECKKRLAMFLQSLGIEPGDRQSYWSMILSTPQLEARRRLFAEEQALDARWNKAVLELLQKGYTADNLPRLQELENYTQWDVRPHRMAG